MLQMLLQNSENGDIFDITSVVSDIQITTEIEGQAGKLTFFTLKDDVLKISSGSRLQVKWGDKGIFFGYVFNTQTDKKGNIKVTAYDQLRYLKNTDFYINKGETLAQTFEKECTKFNLQYKIEEDSGYVVQPKLFDGKSIYDILKYSVEANLRGVKKYYIIYDDYGTIKLNNIEKLRTGYVIGDYSMATDYRYSKSIDKDTYNQIFLFTESKDDSGRIISNQQIAKDSDNQKRWGILQLAKKVNEKATQQEVTDFAKNLLSLYNRERETLSINAIAIPNDNDVWDIRAGAGIFIDISSALGDIGTTKTTNKEGKEVTKREMYLISRCTHALKNENLHTIRLDIIKETMTQQQKAGA